MTKLPAGITPPGWPTSERMAAIMEAIRRDFERYRAEFDARDKDSDADVSHT